MKEKIKKNRKKPTRQEKKELRLKEKEREASEELARKTGIFFSSDIVAKEQGFPYAKYFVNALAMFGAVYGALNCLASAFEIAYFWPALLITCLVLSLLMSFMYTGQKFKIKVYLCIMLVCFVMVMLFFIIINSGTNALRNLMLLKIDEVFPLPRVREYTEYFTNQYISITVALCVIALAMMIIVNIFISEYMNILGVLAVTFPFVQAGMYFSLSASKMAMLCVMGSWLLVAAVGHTNAYNGLTRKMYSVSSVKKHKHYYGFVTDSQNVSSIAGILMIFILLFCSLLMIFIPQSSFTMTTPLDSMKNSTNNTVKEVLSYGWGTLFPSDAQKYEPGQISNSGSLSYDGQTDLEVTFVDYTTQRIYLRQVEMENYAPYLFQWYSLVEASATLDDLSPDDLCYNRTGNILQYDYENNQSISTTRHRMDVKVIDPVASGENTAQPVPYYAVLSDEKFSMVSDGQTSIKNITDGTVTGTVASYTFYSQDAEITPASIDAIYAEDADEIDREKTMEDEYVNTYVQQYCLNVPDENKSALEEICKTYGLSSDSNTVVEDVVNVLRDNYDYTLRPGKVPRTEDFVNYFLLSSKKGYCVHFASSATLLLRYLGVPARYVEGYVIDPEDYRNAKTVEGENASDWIQGVDASGAAVETIPISDANGHAWVEVYEPKLGWIPVEATLATSIDDENGGFLLDFFGLASTNSNQSNMGTVMNQINELDLKQTKMNMMRFIIIFLLVIAGVYLIRMHSIVHKRHESFRTSQWNMNLKRKYQHLYNTAHFLWKDMEYNMSYEKFSAYLCQKQIMAKEQQDTFYKSIEQAVFSKEGLSEKDCKEWMSFMDIMLGMMTRQFTVKQKIQYYLIKILW